ncbi:hypothetical protein ACLBR5_15160 [Escherichia coli]
MAKLATLSDGTVFEPVNSFPEKPEEAGKTERQLSRKVKFSNNWQKRKREDTSDCIPVSQISAGTTFTKSQRPSAKTTQ